MAPCAMSLPVGTRNNTLGPWKVPSCSGPSAVVRLKIAHLSLNATLPYCYCFRHALFQWALLRKTCNNRWPSGHTVLKKVEKLCPVKDNITTNIVDESPN